MRNAYCLLLGLSIACGQAETESLLASNSPPPPPPPQTPVPIPEVPQTTETPCRAVNENIDFRLEGPAIQRQNGVIGRVVSSDPLELELESGQKYLLRTEALQAQGIYIPLWVDQELMVQIQKPTDDPTRGMLALSYLTRPNRASGLIFAIWNMTTPPRIANVSVRYEDEDCASRGELHCGKVVNRTMTFEELGRSVDVLAGEYGYVSHYVVHNGASIRVEPSQECEEPQRGWYEGAIVEGPVDG